MYFYVYSFIYHYYFFTIFFTFYIMLVKNVKLKLFPIAYKCRVMRMIPIKIFETLPWVFASNIWVLGKLWDIFIIQSQLLGLPSLTKRELQKIANAKILWRRTRTRVTRTTGQVLDHSPNYWFLISIEYTDFYKNMLRKYPR